jgi:hypothetical protein
MLGTKFDASKLPVPRIGSEQPQRKTARKQKTPLQPSRRVGNGNDPLDSIAGIGHLTDMMAELWIANRVPALQRAGVALGN